MVNIDNDYDEANKHKHVFEDTTFDNSLKDLDIRFLGIMVNENHYVDKGEEEDEMSDQED